MGALFGSSPKIEAPVIPPAPPSAAPATFANPAVSLAGNAQRQMAAAAAGGTVTNTGGEAGQPAPDTTKRSLLG